MDTEHHSSAAMIAGMTKTASQEIWSGAQGPEAFKRLNPAEFEELFIYPPEGEDDGQQRLLLGTFRHPQLRTALHFCAMRERPEWIATLLEGRADPAQTDIFGKTALHLAAERMHLLSCQALVMGAVPTQLSPSLTRGH